MADEQSDVLDRVEKRLPELPADKPSVDMAPPPAASSPGIADFAKVPEGLKSDLIGAVRGKQAAVADVNAQTDRRVEEDRTRALQLGATGVGPESEIKPWDAKAKAQEYSHDPLDSFGSFASIFAITASAFTKAPFENALNGSAAAINAIKAGDEKGYERAYTAWKDNNELAIKRANLQHQKYQEAMDLMKTDMNRGAAKALAVAAQFDDQKTIALIQNGMIPEFFQTQAAAAQATQGMSKAHEAIIADEGMTFRNNAMRGMEDFKSGDPVRMLRAFNVAQGLTKSNEQEAMLRFIQENPKATADEYAAQAAKIRRPMTPQQELVARQVQSVDDLTQKYIDEGMGEADAGKRALEETMAATKHGSGGGLVTEPRLRAQDIDSKTKEYEKAGMTHDEARKKAVQEANKTFEKPLSPGQADKIQQAEQRITRLRETTHEVEAMLAKTGALTGLGGKVTRPAEVVGNWFGKNETARADFKERIAYMRLLAIRALTEANGRGLKAEADLITSVLPGLEPGSTTQNTVSAYRNLDKIFERMNKDLAERGNRGYGDPPPTAGAPSAPSSRPAWMDAPLKQ